MQACIFKDSDFHPYILFGNIPKLKLSNAYEA